MSLETVLHQVSQPSQNATNDVYDFRLWKKLFGADARSNKLMEVGA